MKPPATVPPIKVLLVEDNSSDARLVQGLLGETGLKPVALTHALRHQQAVECLRREGFNAILLDLDLPDSQGIETFRRIHAEASDAAILVFTGVRDEEVAITALREGAQDYLIKGQVDGHVLRRSIEHSIERKRAEAKVRWLTLAVEQSPAAVFLTDLDGKIEYVNHRLTESTGYAAAEIIGRTPRIFRSGLTPAETYRALWETILAGKTWRGEIQNRRKSGELYWDAVVISPIRDPRGVVTHFLAVQEDATERKRAEEALQESELHYHSLFDNMLNGYAYCRMIFVDGRPQDFTYLRVNRAFETLTRLKDVTGKNVSTVIPGIRESDPGLFETYGRVALTGVPERFETYVEALEMWFDISVYSPRKEHIVAVFDVITDRKQSGDALRESEERFRQMAEHIKEAFFLTEVHTMRPLYISPTWEEIWGRPVEEAYANPGVWFESIHPEDRSRMSASLEAGQRGEETLEVYRILRPDGSQRWVRARAFPIRDSSGAVYRLAGFVEDITELRRVEGQAIQAQRMEVVGRLAGGVAHDFNNLLTVIMGEVELTLMDGGLSPSFAESLGEIKNAAERASVLTRQLLAFSRRQLIEPVVLNLNDVVTDMNKMLVRLIGEDVPITTRLAKDPGLIRADRGQIEQVLTNLVINARDAMPDGGTLILQTEDANLDAEYAHSHADVTPGRYAMLSVSDTGTGMTDEVKAHIFEPYFTTKERGKGTGLGLAICFGIVKQTGGHINCYSELGIGTTIKVYLPQVEAAGKQSATVAAAANPRGEETILLVEDETAVRRVAARVLRAQGYRVLEARDAEQAMMLLRSEAEVSLLLTDVVLPGLGGRKLAEQIKAIRPGIKVLFASGYTDDVIVHHQLLAQGIALVQKPFTRDLLSRKVREVLDS